MTTAPPAPKPKPVYRCDSLKASATRIQAGKEVTFTASGTAQNGAKITSYTYTYGDGASATTGARTVKHTYAKAGSYTATLKVNFTVDGKSTSATSAGCAVKITVETPPTPDVPSIDITKTVNNVKDTEVAVNEEFEYEIVVKNTGKVVLKNAVVTDNAPSQVKLLSADQGKINGNTWTYTIPTLAAGESKSFAIKAKYTAYVAGTHVNKVCVDTPTIPGSPDDCDEASTHTFEKEKIKVCDTTDNTIKVIEKEEFDESTMTTDLSKCQSTPETPETPETPTELPHTGIADGLTGFLGLGSIAGAGYAFYASRRHL